MAVWLRDQGRTESKVVGTVPHQCDSEVEHQAMNQEILV